jgi:hypothetical protein
MHNDIYIEGGQGSSRTERHRVQIFISMKTMSLCLHSLLFSAHSHKLLDIYFRDVLMKVTVDRSM